jgi:general secretion pathway protein G
MVELLTVMGIVAILTALLFPVLSAARAKGRESVCISNLRQIGLSVRMYSQDYDGKYPWALDATDKYTPQNWDAFPEFQTQIPFMPLLNESLQPYIRSKELFHCPADRGYSVEDDSGSHLDATPTSFERFGTSYNWRTELAFRQVLEDSVAEPARLNLAFDAAGRWHGDATDDGRRYSVLHGDGHTKSLNRQQYTALWRIQIK